MLVHLEFPAIKTLSGVPDDPVAKSTAMIVRIVALRPRDGADRDTRRAPHGGPREERVQPFKEVARLSEEPAARGEWKARAAAWGVG